jgi:hypothetical protein
MYKYIGPNILSKAFNKKQQVSFKCSLPKDYNDPFELFLSIDIDDTDLLAYYKEIINIPQRPTTCFSNSPSIIPMWAHYAHTGKGFVIEIDENLLNSYLQDSIIKDVNYSDIPNPDIITDLNHAFMTHKPRHSHFLRQLVCFTAYFTKKTCWSYEQEKRLMFQDNDIETINFDDENMLLYIPVNCVTAIICGYNANQEYTKEALEISKKLNCNFYKIQLGKNSSEPFFKNEFEDIHVFRKGQIENTIYSCNECGEPIKDKLENKYKWCKITEEDAYSAALTNPLRIIKENLGIDYPSF